MRKEVLFAIILGLILGVVIIYGIQIANRSAKELAKTALTPTPTQEIQPNTPVQLLTITSPQDHSVNFTDTVIITGTTKPNSEIIIINVEEEILTKADSVGLFSAKVKLTGGENIITISSLSPDQKQETIELTVTYTSAKKKKKK
ncbi:hypothetical protein HYS10_01015 [Candidatus Collierbacteria bacterium]|nr:hypothetical protein [Candidatus Collierbacteria bacterium]